MQEYSAGVLLTWQVAALEALSGKHEFIEREHIMIGLTKIEEALAEIGVQKIVEKLGDAHAVETEVRNLAECMRHHGVDLSKTRGKLRHLMGTGQFHHDRNSETVHRGPACREVFDLAPTYTQPGESYIGCLHLLAALLSKPGVRVAQALVYGGADVQALQRGVLKELEVSGPRSKAALKPSGLLAKYGTDLTQLAAKGEIEPFIGRRNELLQLIRTLGRKTKNNPILIGDPGVGKTAMVHALALRISQKKTPASLSGKQIIELNLGALVAGTKYRGEFEERITKIVEEIRTRPDVILFIDEIHTLVKAGAAEGGLDAANLLKPALSGSELRCIGATTLSEYRKYFEKDAALARRFQPIVLEEPAPAEALKILNGLRECYEKHHGVRILTSALKSAVDLGCRYILDRKLPDKALDLLDEACARVKIGSVSFRADETGLPPEAIITPEIIAQVISERTGIPVARLSTAGQQKLQHLAETLSRRVIGQPEAVEKVTRIVTTSRAGLRDPRKPIGVLLFVGPTGVGKTELCKALADFLFGSELDLIRLDMSEYKEKHSISRLIGAPPGYIGHEEEGQLTGRLRRKPYSVVLLDEIEKAHPEVCDLFLALFDEGNLTDSHGRTVDGKNAIYVMTSNVAVPSASGKHVGFGIPDTGSHNAAADDSHQAIRKDLLQVFRAEFLNRIDEVVLFRKLSLDSVKRITAAMLERIERSLLDQGIEIEFADGSVELIAKTGHDPLNGARPLARTIDRLIGGPLSQKMIAQQILSGDRVTVTLDDGAISFVVAKATGDTSPTR